MTTIENTIEHVPGLDDPTFAHMPEGKVYEDGDMLTALCGTRLIGVEASPDAPHCPECERLIEEIFRKSVV